MKLKSNDIHYYSNKKKAFLLLVISLLFTVNGIFFHQVIFNSDENNYKNIILLLGFILFLIGIFISVIYLTRTKPLLTITDNEIIIYDILSKQKRIKFKEIKSFFIIATRHRGIVTNRQIFIEMKMPIDGYTMSLYYRLLSKMSLKLANSQFAIQTNFINVNHNILLDILNKKIKNVA